MNQLSSGFQRLGREQVKSLLAYGLLPEAKSESNPDAELIAEAADDDTGGKMAVLLADLKQPVLSPEAGPLSFSRLTGLADDECVCLVGKHFLRAVTSSKTTARVLQALVEYGELLTAPAFPATTQLTGAMIRAVALAALSTRFGISIGADDSASVAAVLDAISASKFMPPALREHASQTKSRIRAP